MLWALGRGLKLKMIQSHNEHIHDDWILLMKEELIKLYNWIELYYTEEYNIWWVDF